MKTKMVSIPKKNSEDIDWELVEQFKKGLKELKEGKVIEC